MSEIVKSDKAAEPEVVFSPSQTDSARVKALIPEGEVYELDPTKKYVIVCRQEILNMQDVGRMITYLKAMGIQAAVMSYRGGPIKDGIQVMEDLS